MDAKTRSELTAFLDVACRSICEDYRVGPRYSDYLKRFGESATGFTLSEEGCKITLEPGFFADNYALADGNFQSMIKRLSIIGFDTTVSCGSYEFMVLGWKGIAILKDGELVCRKWDASEILFRPARTFMDLVRSEGRDAETTPGVTRIRQA